MPIEKVVDSWQRRKEEDDPTVVIVYALRDVPLVQVSKVMQMLRKLRTKAESAGEGTNRKLEGHLKTVVQGPSHFAKEGTAAVLFSAEETSTEGLFVPEGASVAAFSAPAEPPISTAQAELWCKKHKELWPSTYRPLPKELVPARTIAPEEVFKHESFMKIAIACAKSSVLNGEVCSCYLNFVLILKHYILLLFCILIYLETLWMCCC